MQCRDCFAALYGKSRNLAGLKVYKMGLGTFPQLDLLLRRHGPRSFLSLWSSEDSTGLSDLLLALTI